jgi:hypothetical protein
MEVEGTEGYMPDVVTKGYMPEVAVPSHVAVTPGQA